MRQRQAWFTRLHAVEREFLAATVAAESLEDRLRTEPGLLRTLDLRAGDARNFRANLEGTDLIRIFAVFEAGLRELWARGYGRDTTPRMRDLIAAVAARQLMPDHLVEDTDAVREYRNALVHETGQAGEVIPLRESRSRLCHYLSRLPLDW
jgi:hypothetical protein